MRALVQLALLTLFGVCAASLCDENGCPDDFRFSETTKASNGKRKIEENKKIAEQLRRASFRWGKRASSDPAPEKLLKASSRFWGKRSIPDDLRKASIRWGKRKSENTELLPGGNILLPLPIYFGAGEEETEQELDQKSDWLERVTKAENLRPKLALSSRLWGR